MTTNEIVKHVLERHGAPLHVDLVVTIAHQVYNSPASSGALQRACRRLAVSGEIIRLRRGVYAYGVKESRR